MAILIALVPVKLRLMARRILLASYHAFVMKMRDLFSGKKLIACFVINELFRRVLFIFLSSI